MTRDVETLSERERATLRLLLAGHDAKSIAREHGVSVHSVNERLRAARHKLGVTSSREAARILGDAEEATPNSFGDKELGVATSAADSINQRRGPGAPMAWLAGGMLIMSLIIAAVILTSLQGGGTTPQRAQAPAATPASEAETASSRAAREWLALVDSGQWAASWREASAMFRAQVTAQQWESSATPVRGPLGAVGSRSFMKATRASELPGAPVGEYELIEFLTQFAEAERKIETVVMVREGDAWKVSGYFVR